MKYYTLRQEYDSVGTRYYYEGYDSNLLKMDAKHLTPRIVDELKLTRIFKEGSINLDFCENNIYVGEINGYKYYACGERIQGAATDACKKMFDKRL